MCILYIYTYKHMYVGIHVCMSAWTERSVFCPLFLSGQDPVLQNLQPPRHRFPGSTGKGGTPPRLISELAVLPFAS